MIGIILLLETLVVEAITPIHHIYDFEILNFKQTYYKADIPTRNPFDSRDNDLNLIYVTLEI